MTWPWSTIKSWFFTAQPALEQGEDDCKENAGPKKKTAGGFKKVSFLCWEAEAGETKSETCVKSNLTDLVLYALEGGKTGYPLKRQKNEQQLCDKCKTYKDAVKKERVITMGAFYSYIDNHKAVNSNGAKSVRSVYRPDAAGEMAELQLAYG